MSSLDDKVENEPDNTPGCVTDISYGQNVGDVT